MKTTKVIVPLLVFATTLSFAQPSGARKMRVGYWTSGFSLGFGSVMEQMKFAENQGLNVEWVKFAEVNGPTRA
ncbi:MAG TPA: ABC transporter substrate-binding protein, partial [Candidatus Binatia bacterium]|nr:ABC transporter substrate-binding protein [Candidatus Binatia bacterium]